MIHTSFKIRFGRLRFLAPRMNQSWSSFCHLFPMIQKKTKKYGPCTRRRKLLFGWRKRLELSPNEQHSLPSSTLPLWSSHPKSAVLLGLQIAIENVHAVETYYTTLLIAILIPAVSEQTCLFRPIIDALPCGSRLGSSSLVQQCLLHLQ
jgi:hypothetical protein